MATTTLMPTRSPTPATDDICAALSTMADEKSEWGMDDPDLDQEGDEEMAKWLVDIGAFGPC